MTHVKVPCGYSGSDVNTGRAGQPPVTRNGAVGQGDSREIYPEGTAYYHGKFPGLQMQVLANEV